MADIYNDDVFSFIELEIVSDPILVIVRVTMNYQIKIETNKWTRTTSCHNEKGSN